MKKKQITLEEYQAAKNKLAKIEAENSSLKSSKLATSSDELLLIISKSNNKIDLETDQYIRKVISMLDFKEEYHLQLKKE